MLAVALCMFCVAFGPAPAVLAASPDGAYKLKSASGTLSVGGETVEIPQDLLNDLGALKSGKIVIRNSKIQLNRNAAEKIITKLGDQFGIEFETSISGPTSITLKKVGNAYVGATRRPIVLKFATSFEGQEISGTLRTNFRAKVRGSKLILDVPISGRVLGQAVKGEARVICKR